MRSVPASGCASWGVVSETHFAAPPHWQKARREQSQSTHFNTLFKFCSHHITYFEYNYITWRNQLPQIRKQDLSHTDVYSRLGLETQHGRTEPKCPTLIQGLGPLGGFRVRVLGNE